MEEIPQRRPDRRLLDWHGKAELPTVLIDKFSFSPFVSFRAALLSISRLNLSRPQQTSALAPVSLP